MITLLLIVICIVFIGLGLPDSLLGSAWPAIFVEFNLPVSSANFLTMLISSGTVLASVFSAKLINKFGTGPVTAASTMVTTFCLLGFSFSQSIWWFVLLSLPLGAGAGAIDAALNNFVAVHYNSSHMSFLHCFYGLGVAVSPYIMSFALNLNNDWRLGYRTVFFIMLAITLISLLSLPLWNKIKFNNSEQSNFTPKTLSLLQMAKMPAVRTSWVLFFASVALEFTCGIWCCTYLVMSQGMLESLAAKFLTVYYVGMTLGRFTSGLINKKLHPQKVVYVSYGIMSIGIITLFLPLPPIIKGFAIFFIGFGNGPIFPNMIYLTPINLGKEISQSIIGTQMACCNLGILLMPPLFGLMAQYLSVHLFPYYLSALFIITVVSTLIYNKIIKKQKKEEISN